MRIAGALLLPPGDPRIQWWQHQLALPNPAHRRWRRHGRGRAPEETIHPVGVMDGGPWAGGALVPRHAPGAVGVDRTVYPPADPLTLRAELRPYQADAVEDAMAAGEGVIVAPCGAGKTVIGCALIAEHPTPALVLVHTMDLLRQWQEQVEVFLGVEAAVIGDGKAAPDPSAPVARVTIASMQTLVRLGWWRLYELARRWGLIIVDEAHHIPARTFALVAAALPARARIGLTATPHRADGLTPWLGWILGQTVATITARDLEDAGRVLAPTIRWVRTPPLPAGIDEIEAHERDEVLATDLARNALLVDLARDLVREERRLLILVRLVAHARELADALADEGLVAHALTGDLPRAERTRLIDRMRAGSIEVIVATSLADEGLDAPRLDTLILAAPTGNVGRVVQRIGRVCRPHPEAQPPLVVDLVDDTGICLHYARRRAQLYEGRGWRTEEAQ